MYLAFEPSAKRAISDQAESQARVACSKLARGLEDQLVAFARLEVPDAPDNDGIGAEKPHVSAKADPVCFARFDGDDRVPDHVDAPGIDSFDCDGVARGRL